MMRAASEDVSRVVMMSVTLLLASRAARKARLVESSAIRSLRSVQISRRQIVAARVGVDSARSDFRSNGTGASARSVSMPSP